MYSFAKDMVKKHRKRFLQYCLVGLSGVFVNLGIYWVLTRLLLLDELFSYAVSIEISIITNFIFNDNWTFQDRTLGISLPLRFLKFHAVSLAGMGINWGVFALLFRVLGVFDIFSALVGIAAATLWNYFVNFRWTWKKPI